MPTTLTDDPSQFPDVYAPAPGDLRNQANYQPAFQAIANRTAYLLSLLAKALRLRDGTVAQMQALAVGAGNDGECWGVPRQGVYVYEYAAIDAPDPPWIYAPTNNTGRWVHVLAGLIDVSPGLDSSNRIVDAQSVAYGGSSKPIFSTTSTSFVDVDGMSVKLSSCRSGDRLIIDAVPTPSVTTPDFANYSIDASGQVAIVDGGNVVSVAESYVSTSVSFQYDAAHRFATVYTVANTGAVTVKAQLKSNSSANTVQWMGPTSLRVIQVRPSP